MNREALAAECVRIERCGGSVREYLANRGCISPWGTWFRLQLEQLGRRRGQITDGKGGPDVRKITLEQKKRAVEIALGGGNPLPWLKECGSKKPEALWYTIKQNLKVTDPEAFAKLPERVGAKPTEEDMQTESAAEEEEKIMVEEISGTEQDDLQVSAVRSKALGEFRYNEKDDMIEWRNLYGDEVIMRLDEWRKLNNLLPKILQSLYF